MASERRLRVALAERAYRDRTVRLTGYDLSGCTHLVATRRGLLAVNPSEQRVIAHGLFFGITVRGDDIFAFEACGEPRALEHRGRIVRLRRAGVRIASATIMAEGLNNGCHQIDCIGETLVVTDTYRQRILAIGPDGEIREFDPMPPDGSSFGYVHVNSLIASGDRRLLLLHNDGARTGRASEVAVLDADWRVLERRPLAGFGCHNLAILEDGVLLSCGSAAGELIGSDGVRVKVTDLMTRGLSVGQDEVVVGGSTFSERDLRDAQAGAVYFLDRRYQLLATLPLASPPMDICRIDGVDLSLSNHLSMRSITVRWPDRPPQPNENTSRHGSNML